MPRLSNEHANYLTRLWKDLREANKMTRRFQAEWEVINASIDQRHQEERLQRERTGQTPLTDLMVQRDKEASIALNDAYGAANWWQAKAVWLAQAIQAEKAAMEMLNGNDGGNWSPPYGEWRMP